MQQNNEYAVGSCQSNDSPSEPNLIACLKVLLKQRRMIFRITLATAIIALIYTLLLPNTYTAKTLILPSQEDRGMMSAMMNQLGGLATLAGGAGVSIGGPSTTELYVTMLKSEAVMDSIIDRFKLIAVYGNKFRTDAYGVLNKNTEVTTGKKDGVITIAVSDKDPNRAAAMANAFVEALGRLALRLNIAGAGQNRSFLEDRLVTVKADLAKAEESLKNFQTKNKAVQVTAQAEATIKGVAELKAQLAAQEVQLATHRRQFTNSSQEVKTLATLVSNLRSQISKLEGTGGGSAIPSVGSLPTIGQEYSRLMREFKLQESLVELLTKQYEMAKLTEVKDISPFQVIQIAKVPERKSSPKRFLIVILSTLLAFSISVLFAFIREYVDNMSEGERARLREVIDVSGMRSIYAKITSKLTKLFLWSGRNGRG